MDLDLGNSIVLKKFLLPEAQWPGDVTTFDHAISAIGKGVAGAFDRFCNRLFKRSAAHVDQFTADRAQWFVRATPLESVATVEQKYDEATGWVAITPGLININEPSGRVNFGRELYDDQTLIRITYAGGYWYDSSDEQNGTMPAGATLLPAEVHLAWLTQCQHLWSIRDKTGLAVAKGPGEASKLGDWELLMEVRRALVQYMRWQ